MNTFKIQRKSGTYAELLEIYGLANLLNNILLAKNIDNNVSINSIDDSNYEIRLSQPLPDDLLEEIGYFPLFKYIKPTIKDADKLRDFERNMPTDNFYDYPILQEWKNEKRDEINQVHNSNLSKDDKQKRVDQVELFYDANKPIPIEIDVITQIQDKNNFASFDKLYRNLSQDKGHFTKYISEIISYYNNLGITALSFKSVTATQLLNPNQGKGLKAPKANSINGGNFNSNWISESMKISGALSDMICQLVKVGGSYDLKVFVPEYKEVNFTNKLELIKKFKKYLKGNTSPIKIDILNILLLTQLVIEHYEFMGRRKIKDIVSGLHSVYQKNLGQNKAVVNIGFIQVLGFIEISTKEENWVWIEILEEQRKIISYISDLGSTTQGLLLYRNFISGGNLDSFFKFTFWYANYLSTELSNKKYARPFSIETLNKFYYSMDTEEIKLSEIINNNGFKSVAEAIRESTVSLLKLSKDARKYDIRYGVAQTLQSKSKTSSDLAEYIGDFISFYNSETAMKSDKGINYRSYIRENELTEFYSLLDKFPSKLVGSLLASYGFALPAKDSQSTGDVDNGTQNENTEN